MQSRGHWGFLLCLSSLVERWCSWSRWKNIFLYFFSFFLEKLLSVRDSPPLFRSARTSCSYLGWSAQPQCKSRSPVYRHICLMNYQRTHQNNLMAPWGLPLDPLGHSRRNPWPTGTQQAPGTPLDPESESRINSWTYLGQFGLVTEKLQSSILWSVDWTQYLDPYWVSHKKLLTDFFGQSREIKFLDHFGPSRLNWTVWATLGHLWPKNLVSKQSLQNSV